MVASPASAAPDTMIDIHEEPIGVSETHLFLLRTSKDNLGYYEAMRVEMFLIIRDFASGEESHVVIDKFVHSSDYSDEGEFEGYSIKRDAGVEPVDPYRFLQERGALPWPAVSYPERFEYGPKITMGADAVEVQFGSTPPLTISRVQIQEKLDRVKDFMAHKVTDHRRSSSMTTKQFFEWREVQAKHCYSAELLGFWMLGQGNRPYLMRVDCAFDGDSETTSIVLPLPKPAN